MLGNELSGTAQVARSNAKLLHELHAEIEIRKQAEKGIRASEARFRALTGPDGSVIGMQSTSFDITLRKQLEVDLQARNEELVRFVYTVSHDLKSPLVTIQTFLGFLEKDLAKNDAERVKTDFGYIDRAAIKMLDLLEELLELSRIGRKMNPAQDVPFEELVGAALDAVAGQIVERRVEISLNQVPLLLHGDRPRLTEVF